MAFDITSNYYSGQGVVLVGARDPITFEPVGLLPIGNVTDLKIIIENTTKEHKESQTGQRGIDKRLVLETKCGLQMTVEHYNVTNLQRSLRATSTYKVASTSGNYEEMVPGFLGRVSATTKVNWTQYALYHLTVATAALLDEYSTLMEATGNWDYTFNADAGSFWLNDGHPDFTKITSGAARHVDAVATGASTTVTLSSWRGQTGEAYQHVQAGDFCVFTGFTGADYADINGIVKQITAVDEDALTVTFAFNSSAKDIAIQGSGGTLTKCFLDHDPIWVKGKYTAQVTLDALTTAPQEFWLRFEGLNTAADNLPVVIDVFRFAVDPLKELAMISDDLQQFVLEGNVLADSSRLSGSKYFRQRMAVNTYMSSTNTTGPSWES